MGTTPQELFEQHGHLAERAAHHIWNRVRIFVRPLVQEDDLEAAATVALWDVAQRWDEGEHRGRTFEGWAMRIISRRLIDYLRETAGMRRKFRIEFASLDAPGQLEKETVGAGISDGTWEDEQRRERLALLADTAMRRVPRGDLRAMLRRYFLCGQTMQEIADELGVSESRISQRIAEALDWARTG